MAPPDRSSHFQPHVDRMAGYLPGEQPRDGEMVKLNTNENPYPPSPRVAEAIATGLDGRLRRYPDPVGSAFRRVAAELHGVEPSMILPGNGSDDLLTILTRAFTGPGDVVACPSPSYILYKTLAEIQDARIVEVPFDPDWRLNADEFARAEPRLTFVANPNSPSGTRLDRAALRRIAEAVDCPLVVDEAYVDFADEDAIPLIRSHSNVVVLRTLSKGYGLAGLRIGYAIARPEVIEGLIKVKDSYNADTLSLLGGAAALLDQAYLDQTRSKIVETRRKLADAMRGRGYVVPESQANFVWCVGGPGLPAASETYEALKARKILVRLMRYPGHPDGIRVTVGTDAEVDKFLQTLDSL